MNPQDGPSQQTIKPNPKSQSKVIQTQTPIMNKPAKETDILLIWKKWNFELSHCCDDSMICLLGFFVPCWLFGRTKSELSNGQTHEMTGCLMWWACPWICGTLQRTDIREKFEIEDTICKDCLSQFFCHCCALIQESREVRLRKNMPSQ